MKESHRYLVLPWVSRIERPPVSFANHNMHTPMFPWQFTFFILMITATLYGADAATPFAAEVAKMSAITFAILFLGIQLFRIGRDVDTLKENNSR